MMNLEANHGFMTCIGRIYIVGYSKIYIFMIRVTELCNPHVLSVPAQYRHASPSEASGVPRK